jgi:hypothetical protein
MGKNISLILSSPSIQRLLLFSILAAWGEILREEEAVEGSCKGEGGGAAK